MHGMRMKLWTLATIVLLGSGTGLAEDAGAKQAGMEPLEIVQDCLAALQEGDFGRYVDHLSPEELKLQAGYALLVNSMWSLPAEQLDLGSDPETLLLYRALQEIVRQHTLPESQWGPEQQAAARSRQIMFSQLFDSAFAQAVYSQSVGAPSGTIGVREMCIQSADILKDPKEFLAAALAELSRPTVVTGEGARESSDSSPSSEMVAGYAALTWTLYTRGDYAIAAGVNSQPRESSPISSGPERVNGCATPEASNTQVEFRRIDGQWKIVRLLPTSAMMSTTNSSAPQTYACPPPTYAPSLSPPSVAPASVPALPAEPIVPATGVYR